MTGLCVDYDKETKLENLYKSGISNIKTALEPVLGGDLTPLEPATCFEFSENHNLFLLPGHIRFSDYDSTYNIAQNMTGSLVVFKNVPGAFRKMLTLTVDKYNIDYVIVDMSPSISATNANIFMQSDYFIVPSISDFN